MPPKAPKAKPKPIARRGAAKPSLDEALAALTSAPAQPSEGASTVPAVVQPEEGEYDLPPPLPLPVETKPIAPPKGRLDSLASTRGAGGPKMKFKPKVVVRKSKEERETLDAKFQEQQQAAAAAAAADAEAGRGRGSTRGARGGRGRGRGRGGERGGSDPLPGASGPFALGSVVTANRQKVFAERHAGGFGAGRRSGRMFNFKTKVKAEGAGTDAGAGAGAADGDIKEDYSSSDESDGQRMDVEYIYVLDTPSDDENERDLDREWGAGAPIRIPRIEHVDRQAMVNTESSTASAKKNKAVKDKEMTFETEIKIKEEPEDEPMLPPSSPELQKRRVKITESQEAKRKGSISRRRRSSSRKKKPVITTTEEKEEYERLEADRLDALKQLGGAFEALDVKGKGKEKQEDADGDIQMEEDVTETRRNAETENQVFFFQFPPLLPHLVPATAPPAAKPEPTDADGNGEIKPQEAEEVKPEPSTTAKKPTTAAKARQQLKAQLALLSGPPPSGKVGKLRVHRSGRITMLYGNPDENGDGVIEMEVSRGAPCWFLEDVVVMKEDSPYGDEDKDEKGRGMGIAYSLGSIKGKYVVSPDFSGLIKPSSGSKRSTVKREKKEQPQKILID
ncbi:RNA polymerase III RPC4-domain-containing protein [Sphaerosporella brunnea]|uniref:RNA polymerase III RPC4-domain-containing protein n=1 Tax=Sphaerosporella brunnea TaxID=1250544 RepID=A0A5J5F7T3_9PEZI|nr:RNA polymerase III RPC4-domain-containing protein [Sphaerosporella brunnea]